MNQRQYNEPPKAIERKLNAQTAIVQVSVHEEVGRS
jgi:hypothetical protein